MASKGGQFLFCSKLEQRRAVAVCIHKQCGHLRRLDTMGEDHECKFMSEREKREALAGRIKAKKEDGK